MEEPVQSFVLHCNHPSDIGLLACRVVATMRLPVRKKKHRKLYQHKVKTLLSLIQCLQILHNVPVQSIYTAPFITPVHRKKGFSGNYLGDGPTYGSDSDSDIASILEVSGDSEPEDGEELFSEICSASEAANTDDNEFIDSADEVNDLSDSDGSVSVFCSNNRGRLTEANSDTDDDIESFSTPIKKTKLLTSATERHSQTPDAKERRRLQTRNRLRNRRNIETHGETDLRRAQDLQRQRDLRNAATPEEADLRRAQVRARNRQLKNAETPEARRTRLFNKEAKQAADDVARNGIMF